VLQCVELCCIAMQCNVLCCSVFHCVTGVVVTENLDLWRNLCLVLHQFYAGSGVGGRER